MGSPRGWQRGGDQDNVKEEEMSAFAEHFGPSRVERGLFAVANRLARIFTFLRKDLDAAAERYATTAREQHENGSLADALESYNRALVRSPHNKEFLTDAAEACYGLGDFAQAEKLFGLALKEDYFDGRALKGMAYALHADGNVDHAVYFYFRYLDIVKNDYDALLNLGALFQDSRQYDQAIEYSQRAARVEPEQSAPLHNIAVAYFNLGKFDEAEKFVRRAIAAEQNAESLRLLGLILETLQRNVDSLNAYAEACSLNPAFGSACLDLARMHSKLGHNAEYLEAAKRAVQIFEERHDNEGLARAYWDLGWAWYQNGDWEKSADASRKALVLAPDTTPTRFNLDLVLLLMQHPTQAMEQYRIGAAQSKITDLKTDAIDDLERALAKNDLPGGREILEMLREKYRSLDVYQQRARATL